MKRTSVLAAALTAMLGVAPGFDARAAQIETVAFPGRDEAPLQGWLYRPDTPGPHPAIVALHGCAGLTGKDGRPSPRHDDWGRRLADAGFLVLFPDSFGSRGLGPQCKVEERSVKPSRERVADADAALDYLDHRADVDRRRVSLLGWSNGGSSVLYTVEPRHRPEGGDFARAIAFYPGCRVPLESGRWSTRMPLLILIGESDDWTPAQPCEDLAADAGARNEPVSIVTYPGAYHDFDHPGLPVHSIGGLAFTGDGDGIAHTGTNPAARADAIKRVAAFLAE